MAREAAEKPPEEILSLWKREQAQLKALLVEQDTEAWQRDPAFSGLQRVGGVDLSFVKGDSASACASLVVLSYPELEESGPLSASSPPLPWLRPCPLSCRGQVEFSLGFLPSGSPSVVPSPCCLQVILLESKYDHVTT